MKTKSPECWASDPKTRALRIEISADSSLLLPHNEFLFAELISNGKEQTLRLVFATHEITIIGHALRRIETAMQRMELSYVCPLSPRDVQLIPDGEPRILAVEAKVVTDSENP
jgi:hypothetical protein